MKENQGFVLIDLLTLFVSSNRQVAKVLQWLLSFLQILSKKFFLLQ